MIRPVNDFRIGNLVLDEDGELCKIEQLSSEKMECFQQVSTIKTQSCISAKYPSNIYVIELTKEWLLKAGFELNEDTSIWHLGCYQIYENDLGHFEFCLFRFGEWQQPVEYVHELQNLYFALTGEELVFSTEL